jgi:hypothetical protein
VSAIIGARERVQACGSKDADQPAGLANRTSAESFFLGGGITVVIRIRDGFDNLLWDGPQGRTAAAFPFVCGWPEIQSGGVDKGEGKDMEEKTTNESRPRPMYLYVACGDYPLLVHIPTATRDTTAGSAARHVRRSRMSEESERMKQAVEDLPGDLEFLHRILWVVAEPELRSAEMCGVKVQSRRRAWIDLG